MNNKLSIIVIVVSLFYTAGNTAAQKVTDTIAYSEEGINNDSVFTIKKWYRDFTQQMVEEKTLFKIGINDFVYSKDPFHSIDEIEEKLFMIMFGLGVEQKINPGWSILFEWRTSYEKYSYQWDNYTPEKEMGINGREYNSTGQEYTEKFNLNEFDLGTKHYFNMKRRMSLGECANNFSSNYLILKYSYRAYLKDTYTYTWRDDDKDIHSKIIFGFGLQRRLSKYGFIDLFFGSSINFFRAGYYNGMGILLAEDIAFVPIHFSFNIGFGL